jgi:8-oxo-dGTP pyrophosphatase MutT (NUDIX family)
MKLEVIRKRLDRHAPALADPREEAWRAAVALILHEPPGEDPEVLFIERARREGDPWSGQMAFPGGRFEPRDSDMAATATRETAEEVGLELGPPIARLDDFDGSRSARPRGLVVSAFVYTIEERPELVLSYEVNSTVWVPLPVLLDPGSSRPYCFEREEFGGTFPSIHYDGYIIWGLTYRILGSFFEVLGASLPSAD